MAVRAAEKIIDLVQGVPLEFAAQGQGTQKMETA